MPKLNGFNCLQEIKKIRTLQNVPVYMFSASNIPKEIKGLCIEGGAVKWINKPSDNQGYFKIFDEIFVLKRRK
jgi:CheY-like chemotaxis protein